MAGLDSRRIALVIARQTDPDAPNQYNEVATGYFLTGDLILTVRHVANFPDCIFDVRAEVDESEEDRWSEAQSVWRGVGDVDAMLLRTTRSFGNWKAPTFEAITGRESWESSGYAKIADNEEKGNRKTFPLNGHVDLSLGQGPPELALQTNQNITSNWDDYWKGISGAPVFSQDADSKLIGIITDANRALSNGLIGLPASRLFDEIEFRAIITPSFLEPLPNRPWCLVLTSEGATSGLVKEVAGVLTGFQDEEPRFRELHKYPIEISVLQAICSVESWAVTVDALARADYLIADVTSFEPAVMLLLGIRSVLRRGVTISVTARELASHTSNVPFNVQETKILSYSDDDFYDDLHRAMSEGATNLTKDSNYLDLPAYHAVRAPRPEMWAEEDAKNLLVLCPFSPSYSERYKKLRRIIRANTRNMTPLRMLDLRSPRLVGQALYEQIRWSSHCIVDWTEWSPNVFFELGVRLACSEHNPLCIIDQIELGEDSTDARTMPQRLKQHAMLCELLTPIQYDRENLHEAFKNVLELLLPGPPNVRYSISSCRTLPPGGTFTVAQASFLWRQDHMLTRPDVEQRQRAEQILGKDQGRQPERLVLFADNKQFDAELRAAVREKWIAAWLYLRHLSTSEVADQDNIQDQLKEVSSMVLQALGSSHNARHIRLQKEIRESLRIQSTERGAGEVATVIFDAVLALKASAKSARDDGDLEGAIGHLEKAIGLLRSCMPEPPIRLPSRLASELADTYGMIGGIQKSWGLQLDGEDRQSHLQKSITAYDQGFRYEENLGPGDASTYNRVNRLVGRVLLDPHVLQWKHDTAIDDELRKAEEILKEQLKSVRQKDPWGYLDLGAIRLLRGSADALLAYNDLDRLSPPAFVYESALATLEPLSDAASDLRPDLIHAISQLRSSARFVE